MFCITIFQISTGIALLFGSGVSIVAAIHMSKGNQKAANINITQAFTIGHGLPLFSLCCLFFTLNIVLIGHEQSLERYSRSTIYMLLRGFLLIVPCFILLPDFIGDAGLWLAVPTSEAITLIIILVVKLVEIRRG